MNFRPKAANRHIQKHSGTFHYGAKVIPFCFWSHTDGVSPPDTVIFMGSAQVGKIPKWVAEAAPSGVVVVDGMPHWHAQPTVEGLTEFTHAHSVTALKAVLQEFGMPSAHVVALSQSTIGAVWLARSLPDSVRNFALVAPLGLNADALGNTPEARLKQFKKRALRTYLEFSQSLLHDLRIPYMQFLVLRALLAESEKNDANTKFALALSYDLVGDCREVAERWHRDGKAFKIFLAEHDRAFAPHEILASLERGNIKHVQTITLSGISHPSLASRGNKKALNQIVHAVRLGKHS